MISLYWSVLAFVFLLFSYIDYAFPNVLQYYPANPYESGISGQMASIIVLLPLYLVLVRVIAKDAVKDPSRREIWVRRWAVIFTLFIAGVAIAGDLIMLLTSFLSGEALTTAFLLKVLIVLLVAAGTFMHFTADLKGYWVKYPERRRLVSVGVALLAVVSIVGGFFIVGTPQQARSARFDDQRINDLQNMQSQVTYYYQAKRVLPNTADELGGAVSMGVPLPTDPESNMPYRYTLTGNRSFSLCADFNAASRPGRDAYLQQTVPAGVNAESWEHPAGHYCYERTLDPAFYPPLTK